MRIILFFSLALFTFTSFAQQDEVTLKFGDTLQFGQCGESAYLYIDLYVKTRFEGDSSSMDSLFDWEFYNAFFNTGDFDVSRLPCSYKGKYGIIKHMMAIEGENDEIYNVIIVMIEDGKSAAYIVEDAFIHEEVIYVSSP